MFDDLDDKIISNGNNKRKSNTSNMLFDEKENNQTFETNKYVQELAQINEKLNHEQENVNILTNHLTNQGDEVDYREIFSVNTKIDWCFRKNKRIK